jgi:hypothetical protein
MRTASRYLAASCLLALACEPGGEEGGAEDRPENLLGEITPAPTVTVSEYATSLQFLPFETGRTRSLVLQFANAAAAEEMVTRYFGWQLNPGGWQSLVAVDSQTVPIRAPWRLMPVPGLRLTVNADGDPDDLIFRQGSSEYTLDLGNHLDAWEDRAGTWHEIREAVWITGNQRSAGVVVSHRFALPEPERPTRFGNYERVILRSEDGAIIVLFNTSEPDVYGDPFAWMYADGLTRRWTALESRIVEVASSTRLRRNVPVRLWFRIPEPDIRCELAAAERHFNEHTVDQGPKPYNALYRVRGWIEFSGERRNVEGVLERGEV